jgi:hypothetical protein
LITRTSFYRAGNRFLVILEIKERSIHFWSS